MNMKQALYFKTIAQYGTITAAAKQLYISQPSLSQTLRQIEEEVGTPLFDRSTSPFHLTYAGERYLKAVEAMLEIDARLKAEIESIRHEDGGRLRLGISVTRASQGARRSCAASMAAWSRSMQMSRPVVSRPAISRECPARPRVPST